MSEYMKLYVKNWLVEFALKTGRKPELIPDFRQFAEDVIAEYLERTK